LCVTKSVDDATIADKNDKIAIFVIANIKTDNGGNHEINRGLLIGTLNACHSR
jgi:hypothetical protein